MSLQDVAQHLSSKGRNGDSVLVHMTPGEVRGLEALALRHYGHGLTVNPDTGLPEANILKALLPTIAGVGLSAMGVPPIWAAGIVGGGTALATGSLSQGLMAGLGAYGGAGIGQGLSSMGASAAASSAAAAQAAPSAAAAAQTATAMPAAQTMSAFGDAASSGLNGFDVMSDAASAMNPMAHNAVNGLDMASDLAMTPQAAAAAANPAFVDPTYAARNGFDVASDLAAAQSAAAANMSGWDKLVAGGKDLASPGGFGRFTNAMGGNSKALMAGAAAFGPALSAQPASTKQFADEDSGNIRPYDYDPRTQTFTAKAPYKANTANENWGRYADGGMVEDSVPGFAGGGISSLLSRGGRGGRGGGGGAGLGFGGTFHHVNPAPMANLTPSQRANAPKDMGMGMLARQIDPLTQNVWDTNTAINDALGAAGRQRFDAPSLNLNPTAHSYASLGASGSSGIGGYAYNPQTQGFVHTAPPPPKPVAGPNPAGPQAGPAAGDWFTGFMERGRNESLNGGGFAEGGGIGRLLSGPGDGVSDSIPAAINGNQPARLADGEYVVPARVVSELGNGSTDAGAARLDQMVKRVQQMRSKTAGPKSKVAVDSRAYKALPA